MKQYGTLLIIMALALFSSCVTKKEYDELAEVKEYYEIEAQTADSISNEYNKLAEDNRQLELEIRNTRMELEQLLVTNLSLYRSYEVALQQIEELKNERNELDVTASYEKYSLQKQLSDQETALRSNQAQMEGLEYELYQQNNQLNTMTSEYSNVRSTLSDKEVRIQELEQLLNLKDYNLRQLQDRLSNVQANFSGGDINVQEQGGKLYLSMSSSLLFPSGSTRIDQKGREALRQVASALNSNPDVAILVEGHTDTDGNALTNWNLSVDRAVSVTNLLVSFGVDPNRITAAGRGEHQPVASNATAAGKAQNRRTDIILSPQLDELYEFLSR